MAMLIAHVGHWIGYVLYAIPLLVVAIGIATSYQRSRRALRTRSEPNEAEEVRAQRELDRILSG